MKKVLIGGIGNVLLGDDGVGPYVARLLASRYEFDDGVEVDDLGTPALDIIDQLTRKDAVILIDSVAIDNDNDNDNDEADVDPGTVVLYRKADIMRHRPAVRMDPHSPALVDALLSAELFGVAPEEVLLVGVKAESFEPGCSFSNAVQGSLENAIKEVLSELNRLGVGYTKREHPIEVDIWWTTGDKMEAELAE